jgi:predicted hotdog family 3-hydroxylacyl-ACP dehydratase
MLIKRDELCSLIPHSGTMCLLDKVLEWNDKKIICETHSHHLLNNPLRCEQGLSGIQGIEYGAQAMAVHGGLLAKREGKEITQGFLVALRNVDIKIDWLDTITGPLIIKANQIMHDDKHSIYEFSLMDNELALVNGRTTVMTQ